MLLGDLRAAVANTCRELSRSGQVVGTAGNVSIREGDLIVISPSGLPYQDLTAELVGVHRFDGSRVEAQLAPSSELPLHLAVYRRVSAGAVVHTHASASTALSMVVDEVPASHYYTALFGGPLRVARYATTGTDDLADVVAEALVDRRGALMANHGAITIGGSLTEAARLVPYLEYICDVQLRAMSTGAPVRVLPPDELSRVAALLRGYGQQPPGTDDTDRDGA
ncbi:MAG TPA: class II aldolase/adducin family protein [Dermatophilaceae bacterium]|nr:class II aldolase/adducin family protein [Dermatophilaceae bacterium]